VLHVLHVLLALASLASSELGLELGVCEPVLAPGLLALPFGLHLVTRLALRQERWGIAAVCERMLQHAAPLVQWLAVALFGWLDAVAVLGVRRPDLTSWPDLGLVLALVPYAAAELVVIESRAWLLDPERGSSLRGQVRQLLAALAPLVLYAGLSTLVGLVEPLRVRIETIALASAAWTLFLIALFALSLPRLLRWAWDAVPLPSSWQRATLESVAARAGFRFDEIYLWRTGGSQANAAIVGLAPRSRFVLFSDALLARLGPRELAAVFAHEIGHARARHAPFFVAFALLVFLGADLAIGVLAVESEAAALAILGAILAAWYVAFGWFSRRCELEADLESLELLGDPEPLVTALVQVGAGHAHRKTSWRHFSTEHRARFLLGAFAEPALGERLRSALRRWKRASLALLVVTLTWQAWRLTRALDEDRVVVALCEGEYERAAELANRCDDLGEDTLRLLALARAIPSEERSADRLEADGRMALERGQTRVGLALLELALLRGRYDLRAELEELRASAPSQEDPTERRP
jgi:Zn-dependent protease with chaperone function